MSRQIRRRYGTIGSLGGGGAEELVSRGWEGAIIGVGSSMACNLQELAESVGGLEIASSEDVLMQWPAIGSHRPTDLDTDLCERIALSTPKKRKYESEKAREENMGHNL